ncbi:tyrosine-type recombinase/integrase [Brachybacterium tyrofermentans]|uniref:tyrosine-type recombinase/integrase n=1 Tax=Brachybacterium tyrofermentans TaxID=47848 RepID=UPI003FD41EB9
MTTAPEGEGEGKRRSYGAGSFYQLADGRWRASLSAGYTRTGGRRRVTRTCATEREARAALNALRREAAAAGGKMSARQPTLKFWLDAHLDDFTKTRRSASVASLRWTMTHVVPVIGARRLDSLRAADIRAVHDAAYEAGLSVASVSRIHGALRTALRAAVREGYTVPQSALAAQGPGTPPLTRGAIPEADLEKLIAACKANPETGLRYLVQLYTGARASEVSGLTWDRVDLGARTIEIDRQLIKVAWRHGLSGCSCGTGAEPADCPAREHEVPRNMPFTVVHGAMILAPLKIDRPRSAPIVDAILAPLRERYESESPSDGDLVFTAPRQRGSAVHITRNRDQAMWRALQDAAGVRHASGRYYGTHELRHSTATLLARSGASLATIRAALGHSRIETSLRYQHPDQAEMLAAFGDAFGDGQ